MILKGSRSFSAVVDAIFKRIEWRQSFSASPWSQT
jgi:hypothetical protein